MFGYIDDNEQKEVWETPKDKHKMYEPLHFVQTYIHVHTYIDKCICKIN